jgi:hypothetical protein
VNAPRSERVAKPARRETSASRNQRVAKQRAAKQRAAKQRVANQRVAKQRVANQRVAKPARRETSAPGLDR